MTQYIVFARKYRPQQLSDLVGQNTLQQTLNQSMSTGKLPHAIILNGIRGIGKTTTARIIAKGLNCEKGPTTEPCGVCASCVAITNDRHLDVIEMDAASHTGVDDIREVIETAKYKAVQGKYKVYIIDEVHMLSKSAFNAILKTLEEPPPFVHFIFATTEIQKVPDTVLSRCMRFDLNRMEMDTLKKRLFHICTLEKIHLNEDAATLLARAGDGSMRDVLSLLDQAYALSKHKGIEAEIVRDMLGLSCTELVQNLLEFTLKGQVEDILTQTDDLFTRGADPLALLRDILDMLYNVIVFKTSPRVHVNFTEEEVSFFKRLSENISHASLLQVWQILSSKYPLLHGSFEPRQFLNVLFLQVAYAAPLPPLHELLGRASSKSKDQQHQITVPKPVENNTSPHIMLSSVDDLLNFLKDRKEVILYTHLVADVVIGKYAPGHIVLHTKQTAPKNITHTLKAFLEENTKQPWNVEDHGPSDSLLSIQEIEHNHFAQKQEESLAHPTVKALLEAFPGSKSRVHGPD